MSIEHWELIIGQIRPIHKIRTTMVLLVLLVANSAFSSCI